MLQRFCLAIAVTAVASLHATAQTPVTSASKVKASATATKPDAAGRQVVTVTLDVEKGCIMYANPVGHEYLESRRIRVSFKAKEGVTAEVKYPASRPIVVDLNRTEKITYYVYEGQVKLRANVQRMVGDKSPLLIAIHLHATGYDY